MKKYEVIDDSYGKKTVREVYIGKLHLGVKSYTDDKDEVTTLIALLPDRCLYLFPIYTDLDGEFHMSYQPIDKTIFDARNIELSEAVKEYNNNQHRCHTERWIEFPVE